MLKLRNPFLVVEEARKLAIGDLTLDSMETEVVTVKELIGAQQNKILFRLAPLERQPLCPKHL